MNLLDTEGSLFKLTHQLAGLKLCLITFPTTKENKHLSNLKSITTNMKLAEEIKKIPEEVKKILHIDDSTGKVFVLNGACPIGHRVVERLIDKKYTDLRVGVRTLKEKETDTAIEFVPFVWEDEGTYEAAL